MDLLFDFFSDAPVSDAFLRQLQVDMDTAQLVRFAVAFVSCDGLTSIGDHRFVRLLQDQRSFGIATMACACGYQPLFRLQQRLPKNRTPQLKYFMEPRPRGTQDDVDIDLLHSKLIYLANEETNRSIVYVGSHNWSTRALGGSAGRRNAESSLRIEMPFEPAALTGSGTNSLAADVNRHLLKSFALPAALEATAGNESAFQEWHARVCTSEGSESLEKVAVVLAVCPDKDAVAARNPAMWSALQRTGIYLQILKEDEGETVWENSDNVMLLVWPSKSDLMQARAPVLLISRSTHLNAGPNSKRRGNSQGGTEIAGFQAAVYDQAQAMDIGAGRTMQADVSALVPTGRRVHYFWFEQKSNLSTAGSVDQGCVPLYQHYLQINEVVLPEWMEWMSPQADQESLVWRPDELAFSDRKHPHAQRSPGYRVTPERERDILECLSREFGIDPRRARALPYSKLDSPRVGLRVVDHPVHEAYLDAETRRLESEFYARPQRGRLVPELNPDRRRPVSEDVPRVFESFTTRLRQFVERLRSGI